MGGVLSVFFASGSNGKGYFLVREDNGWYSGYFPIPYFPHPFQIRRIISGVGLEFPAYGLIQQMLVQRFRVIDVLFTKPGSKERLGKRKTINNLKY